MSESRVRENLMHGLTGGSWKRSLRLPRQLPTLLRDFVAEDQVFDVLGGGAAGEQPEPAEYRDSD
jgi:hypothetical protein